MNRVFERGFARLTISQWTTAFAVVLLAAFFANLLSNPLGKEVSADLNNIGQAVAALFATIVIGLRLKSSSGELFRERLGWFFIFSGCLSWAMGQIVYCYYEIFLRVTAPYPSFADIGFSAACLWFVAGVVTWIASKKTIVYRALFNGLTIALATLEILLILVLNDASNILRDETRIWVCFIYLLYPIGEVTLVVVAFLLMVKVEKTQLKSMGVFIVAILSLLVADFSYDYFQSIDGYQTGLFSDFGWPLCFCLLGLVAAGKQSMVSDPETSSTSYSTVRLLLPNLPLALALFVGAFEDSNGQLTQLEWAIALTLLLATLGRNFFILRDNHVVHDQLRLGQERLSLLLASDTELVGIIDKNLRYSYLSPAAKKLFGYSSRNLEGKSVRDTSHPDDADRICSLLQELSLAPGASAGPVAHRIGGKNTGWRWFETSAVNRFDNPSVKGLVFHTRDVTERYEDERAMQSMVVRMNAIISTIRSPLLMEDDSGEILLVNQPFCDLFLDGLDFQHLQGSSWNETTHLMLRQFENPAVALQQRMQRMQNNSDVLGEQILLSDGRHYELNYQQIRFQNGDLKHLWLYNDVTEYANSQELLRQACDRAIEVSELKSAFVATVSHEIRNPMHAVLGLVELLQASELTEEQGKQVEGIRASADGLRLVINDILDMSKIESGRMTVETIIFSLHEAVELLAVGVNAQARAKGITYSCSLNEVPEWVLGDPLRLRQILVNLLDNAVKFTQSGSVRLEVSKSTNLPDGICFQIIDTGIGIPQEAIALLFEPFRQVDSATTRRFGGTGLGLAICKQLAELMGGTLGVKSVEGEGTAFSLEVPFAQVARGKRTEVKVSLESPRLQEDLRVLFADDNEINRVLTSQFLKKLGISATIVTNGQEVVDAFTEGEFDMVLLDCEMPVMDGFEAARIIRSREAEGKRVPIIALTANAMEPQLKHCKEVGMDDCLAKPFSLNALRQKIDQWRKANSSLPVSSETSEQVEDVVDYVVLDDLDDEELAKVLITTFESQLSDRMNSIKEAAMSSDSEELRKAIHRLRSPAAALGLVKLAQYCGDLESRSKGGAIASDDELHAITEITDESLRSLLKWKSPKTAKKSLNPIT